MLTLKNVTLHFFDRTLFDAINLGIAYDEKIAILGRNGAGKSTLLKVIAGQQEIDSGTVSYDKNKKIGYLPQEVILQSNKSVFDEAFSVFDRLLILQKSIAKIENQLADGVDDKKAEQLTDQYVTMQEELEHFDEYTSRSKTESILQNLGFSKERFLKPVNALSVGWKMRIVLAKLLLQEADFYLFDEPTNHLDLPTKEWFLSFLQEASFGYLLVTHDKYYLEHACDKMLELERGKATVFTGSFSSYCAQKEKNHTALIAAQKLQQKEIARKRETINRFRAQATKAAMVQSMIKELENIEIIHVESPLPTVNFKFGSVARAGKIVLDIENVSHAFGDNLLFKNASAIIGRGKKVALIAPNGVGKTTLFNLVVGKLPLQNGRIEFGFNVESAYFEQDQTRVLDHDSTILQEVMAHTPNTTEAQIRTFLGSFLFSGDDVDKKISVLSGGEKNRVAMVKVLLQHANLLLLDEPTNHLDIYAKEILQQALQQYSGTILFVSHDHDFVQQVADTIIALTPDGLHLYEGDYESYLYYKKSLESDDQEKQQLQKIEQNKKKEQPKKQSYEQKKKIRSLESKIKKLESERDKLGMALAKEQYGTQQYDVLFEKFKIVESKIDQQTKEWEACISD